MKFTSEIELIEAYLKRVLENSSPCPLPELNKFWESMGYSVFSPGKRFRPVLSLLTAKALDYDYEHVLPVAGAVELIHTYSLIHDDLPILDNDDLRRGRPTNHKVYGDAMALLAGDGLLTLAFYVLARSPSAHTVEAVQLLAMAAGVEGMVGGQVLDIAAAKPDLKLLEEIHARKTGALIKVAIEGAAVLCAAQAPQRKALARYGENLGLAFQLADDIQDFDPSKPEKVSFVSSLGIEATRRRLEKASADALADLSLFDANADPLREMIHYNSSRA